MRGAVLAMLIAVAAPVAAALAVAPAAPAGVDPLEDNLKRIEALVEAGRIPEALRQIDRKAAKADTPQAKLAYGVTRAKLLAVAGRDPEAIAALDAVFAMGPGNGRLVAATLQHMAETGILSLATHSLERLIDVAPEEARALPFQTVNEIIGAHYGRQQHATARRISAALGRIGYGGDDFETRDLLAVSTIEQAVKADDVEAARFLAATLESTEVIESILTDRRYEPLWPALEARIGPKMEQPRTAALIAAERRHKAEPHDLMAKRTYFAALVNAGQQAEADAFARRFATTPDEVRQLTEMGGWFVNDHARMLFKSGRLAEADARFESLRELDIAKAPWLISMIINRGTGNAFRGQTAKAKAQLEEAAALAAIHGSPYAQQLVDSGRICVAAADGDATVAPALLPQVLERAEKGPIPTIEALLCAGRRDEAAQRVIALLADEERREQAIAELNQPVVTPGSTYAYPGAVAQLLERPDVRAAFDKVARPLPAQFRRD